MEMENCRVKMRTGRVVLNDAATVLRNGEVPVASVEQVHHRKVVADREGVSVSREVPVVLPAPINLSSMQWNLMPTTMASSMNRN